MDRTWNVFVVLLIAGLSLHAQDASSKPAEPATAPPSTASSSEIHIPVKQDPRKVTQGYIVHRVYPKYPKAARRAKVQGPVVLNALIAKDGSIKNLKVISGDPLLVDAAVEAVRKWRYQPYLLNGEPLEVSTAVTVNFTLDGGESRVSDSGQPASPVNSAGDASTDGTIGEIFKVDNGVTAPRPIYSPDPEYSEIARKAKLNGTVALAIIVTAQGEVHHIEVEKSLGMGLDEEAVEAVRKWRFKPAMRNGQPVAVRIKVEVSFRMYR